MHFVAPCPFYAKILKCLHQRRTQDGHTYVCFKGLKSKFVLLEQWRFPMLYQVEFIFSAPLEGRGAVGSSTLNWEEKWSKYTRLDKTCKVQRLNSNCASLGQFWKLGPIFWTNLEVLILFSVRIANVPLPLCFVEESFCTTHQRTSAQKTYAYVEHERQCT